MIKKTNLSWQKCHYGDKNQETCEETDRDKIAKFCNDERDEKNINEFDFDSCEFGLYHATTWNDAKKYCESFGEKWRLPTDTEVLSLFDFSKNKPKLRIPIHITYFPVKISFSEDSAKVFKFFIYWTSTPNQFDSSQVWVVDFDTGYPSLKNIKNRREDRYLVKCVKD